ncbi:hypothetical protein SMI01S_12090 [Sphingobacterium mizutaii NBRC 14946 = DSM 11724]|uniref:Uncharacterized protein n=2 Tax=Sphingobacterium mizutaii TaxID=1010 RepID=A0AAJ5C0U3_9SPHI|nr:hypothetical protein [Sphingobacterium mizutaii]GEM67603.1 hypothetical protein SMI01S_12090 [Sphingobacterium mizutaii NBRC 14946 = DSM 11724]SDL15100.1 hypothetical protein SAMN05192578_1011543 [Sphingobacterium mizutaii]SNV52309.1 Uncharacterised protein [Sphingobacterium mizutaii]
MDKRDELLKFLLEKRDNKFITTKIHACKELFKENNSHCYETVQFLIKNGYITNPGKGTSIKLTMTGKAFIESGGYEGEIQRKIQDEINKKESIKSKEEYEKTEKEIDRQITILEGKKNRRAQYKIAILTFLLGLFSGLILGNFDRIWNWIKNLF